MNEKESGQQARNLNFVSSADSGRSCLKGIEPLLNAFIHHERDSLARSYTKQSGCQSFIEGSPSLFTQNGAGDS